MDKATCLLVLAFVCNALFAESPAVVNNDDSCDITVSPAATLLLPYFEVDLANPQGETTFFTITNVTPLPRIARVTLWTDRAFPVLTFNIFLTGYDLLSINLFDVLIRGHLAEPGTPDSEVGSRSAGNQANPLLDTSACGNRPDRPPPQILANLIRALTVGRTSACANARIGSTRPSGNAVGYATIDVVRNCGSAMPVDAGYFENEILYDNVLIGDYQQVNRTNNFAQGNTLVHIRALPEGGLAGSAQTNLRRTFYGRFQNGGTADRRQPLPSVFAARWIDGGPGELLTSYKVWREGVTGAAAGCAVAANGDIAYPDVVRFDDEENPTTINPWCGVTTCPTPHFGLPALSRIDTGNGYSEEHIPPNLNNSLAGWMYFNLDNFDIYSAPNDGMALQNWVIVSMAAEGRFSVDFDAASLGNGCSPPAPTTSEDGSEPSIAPAPNVNPGSAPIP